MPGPERRRQILTVAYSEFARRGFDAVTMASIASMVGVSKPIVYRLFGSKDGLYAECAARLVDPMLEQVEAAARTGATADAQLWSGIVAQLRYIHEHREEWRVYVREAPVRGGISSVALAEGRQALTELLARLIAHAIETAGSAVPPDLELDVQAHALQGAVEQVSNWWEQHPDEAVEAVALRVMNFAWQGVGAMIEGRFWAPEDVR